MTDPVVGSEEWEESEAAYYEGIETVNDYAGYFRDEPAGSPKDVVWQAILAYEAKIGAWQ